MTPGHDARKRPSGLSRRRLLAGIGGVGAVGMASGIGTGAFLSDRDSFLGNGFGAGSVELTVNGEPTDGRVTVDVSAIGRGPDERGSDSFRVGVRTNPARVWLAAKCPATEDNLMNALKVDVLVDGRSITGGFGPLATAVAKIADGERIDDDCLDPDDGITVDVVAGLPADAPNSLSGNGTSISLELYAEQCRHVSEDEAEGSNPFAGRVCEEQGNCPACVLFGKADDVDSSSLAVGDVLPLSELPDGAGEYEIEITAIETKDNEGDDAEAVGVEFTLRDVDGNPGPDMCEVWIKGGPDSDPEPVAIDPPSVETGKLLFAPLKPDGDSRYGISYIAVRVCSDSGDSDDGDEGDEDQKSDECAVCGDGDDVSLATLDVRYRGDDEPTLAVVSTKGGTGGTLFEGRVADGDVFTLDRSDVERKGNGNGPGRLGPEMEITADGGDPTAIHVSCSEPLAVGMRFGPADEFEIVDGTTITGELLCGSEAN